MTAGQKSARVTHYRRRAGHHDFGSCFGRAVRSRAHTVIAAGCGYISGRCLSPNRSGEHAFSDRGVEMVPVLNKAVAFERV